MDAGKDALVGAIESSSHLNSPETLAALEAESDYRHAIDRVSMANGMACPSQYLAARYDDAYVYHFTRIREGEGGAHVRAYHGAELPYTFGTHPSWMNTTEVDRQLTEQILGYWTSFAADGNPNTGELPAWPAFEPTNKRVIEFGLQAIVTAAPEPMLCRIFWQSVTRGDKAVE